MNPEKLFDYLEGNLKAEDRAQLEAQLATDPQLQRELDIAREMHRRSRGSREVLGESEDLAMPPTPSGKLGRRLAAVFALLVLVNVLVGIAFIIGKNKAEKPADLWPGNWLCASNSRPRFKKRPRAPCLPTLAAKEIHLSAPGSEREALANNVVMLATQCGGSAAKAPPDDAGITVLADLPATREENSEKRSRHSPRRIFPLRRREEKNPATAKE